MKTTGGWVAIALALALMGCSSSGGGDGGDGEGGGGEGGSGSESTGSLASGSTEPLSDVELGLVGVWKGSGNDDEVNYYVLQEDRTGCTWYRDGDDFGRRFDELQFHDWKLETGDAESDGRIPISFVTAEEGNLQDLERYDPEVDQIHLAGFREFPMTWQDILIRCEDEGTDAVELDVERRGTYPKPDDGGAPSE